MSEQTSKMDNTFIMFTNQTSNTTVSLWETTDIPTSFLVLMVLFFVLGCLGNTLIILYYPHKQKQFYMTNFFIRKLALVDLCACALVIPYSVVFEANVVRSETVCKLMEFIRYFTVSDSLLTLLSVCLERFFAVCYPLKMPSNQQAWQLVLCTTSVSVASSLPAFWVYTVYERMNDIVPGQLVYSCHPKVHISVMIFNLLLMIMFFSVIVIITVLYIKVFRTISQRVRRVAPNSTLAKMALNLDQKNPDHFMVSHRTKVANTGPTMTSPKAIFVGSAEVQIKADITTRGSGGQASSSSSSHHLEIPSEKALRMKRKAERRERSLGSESHSRNNGSVLKEHLSESAEENKIELDVPEIHEKAGASGLFSHTKQHSTLTKETSLEVHHDNNSEDITKVQEVEIRYIKSRNQGERLNLTSSPADKIQPVKVDGPSPAVSQNSLVINNIRTHFRLATMLFGVFLIFVLSWMPFWLTKFDVISYNPLLHYLFFFNNSSNIIVYVIFNQNFRSRVSDKMVFCWRRVSRSQAEM